MERLLQKYPEATYYTESILTQALSKTGSREKAISFRRHLLTHGLNGIPNLTILTTIVRNEITSRLNYNLSRFPLPLEDRLEELINILTTSCFYPGHLDTPNHIPAEETLLHHCTYLCMATTASPVKPEQIAATIELLISLGMLQKRPRKKSTILYLTKNIDPLLSKS